jgi:hypothetical protein
MKKQFKKLRGLWIAMAVGLCVGIILWITGAHEFAPLWAPIISGLVYLRIQWLRKVNRSKDGIKLKPM